MIVRDHADTHIIFGVEINNVVTHTHKTVFVDMNFNFIVISLQDQTMLEKYWFKYCYTFKRKKKNIILLDHADTYIILGVTR
jgi:hypothetical protein